MKNTLYALAIAALLLTSCENKPSLQKYFVEKAENKNFVAIDVAPGFIKTDSLQLSAEEKTALKSVHNLNILAFKANDSNAVAYEKELDNVKKLLKEDSYDELMKFSHEGMGASISTKGEGEHIEEFIVLANSKEKGFGVVRVTGSDMTPNNVMTIVGLIQKANLNMEQFKPIKDMMVKP